MALDYYAGQRLTADDLQALAGERIPQTSQQDVASSTTLVDTAMVVPVDGLTEIQLYARYTSLAGGIRWAWTVSSGTVTCLSRSIISAGQTPSATNAAEISEMRLRQIAVIDEEQTTAHYTTNTSQVILETLLCEGIGEIMFQFAQQASNASATSLNAASYAVWKRLAG